MKKVLFGDLPIGALFKIYNNVIFKKVALSYDFHGAYNAISMPYNNAREYISNDEYVDVEE